MLKFRPHHFLCALSFQGKGYSDEFIKNFSEIMALLRGKKGDDISIEVVPHTDSICTPCPSKRGLFCEQQEKIQGLDERHAEVLGLTPGQRLTWAEAKEKIATHMSIDKFHRACVGCEWKAQGICEGVLRDFLSPSKKKWFKAAPLLLKSALQKAVPVALLLAVLSSIAIAKPEKKTPKIPNQKQTALPTELTPPAEDTPQFMDDLLKTAFRETEDVKRAKSLALIYGLIFEKKNLKAAQAELNRVRGLGNLEDWRLFLEGELHLEQMKVLLGKKLYPQVPVWAKNARNLYLNILARYPLSPTLKLLDRKRGQVELLSALALAKERSFTESIRRFHEAFVYFSKGGLTVEVSKEALEQYLQGCIEAKAKGCLPWVRKFLGLLPNSAPEFQLIEKFYPAEKVRKQFTAKYLIKTKSYKGPEPDREAFTKCFDTYQKSDYSVAANCFLDVLSKYPESAHRQRVLFWLGKAYKNYGSEEDAKAVFKKVIIEHPFHYYAVVASIESGIEIDQFIGAGLPMGMRRDPALTPEEIAMVERTEALLAGGVPELAFHEVAELKPKKNFTNEFLNYLVTLSHEGRNHLVSFNVIGEILSREGVTGTKSQLLRFNFPIDAFELVRKHAKKIDIDPLLVLSLIKQESAFTADAVSRSGALGMMQVMPYTALEVDPAIEQVQAVDADANVRIGSDYLKRMLEKFKENVVLSLCAYNAGPKQTERWLKATNDRQFKFLEFIESIPFDETRGYVTGILRNYFWYQHLIEGRRYKETSLFWKNADLLRGN